VQFNCQQLTTVYPYFTTEKWKGKDFLMLTREQVRMARAALQWTVGELARQTSLTAKTIHNYEHGGNATIETLEKIKAAFERAGVTWVPENGGPATVRPPRRQES
jgi:transcriptional regulator with XRE-family HTH domain